MSAAELIDLAIAKLAVERGVAFDKGEWTLNVHCEHGKVRRIVGDPRGVKVAFNRDQLDASQPPTKMGESAA